MHAFGHRAWTALAATAIGIATLSGGWPASSANADVTWVLQPTQDWEDEFSPLYLSSDGLVWCEGDPSQPDCPDRAFITRDVTDPDCGEVSRITAVENEVLVDFKGTVSASTLHELFASLGVVVQGAWFEPCETDEELSVSWFNLRITPTSLYYRDVPGLIAYLGARPDVNFAEYNEVLTLQQDPLFPNGAGHDTPDDPDTLWGSSPTPNYLDKVKVKPTWPTQYDTTNFQKFPSAVAVIDSGVQVNHPDLANQIYVRSGHKEASAFVGGKRLWGKQGGTNWQDIVRLETDKGGHGHGTAMAGIIAAETNNGVNVAGCGTFLKILSMRCQLQNTGRETAGDLVVSDVFMQVRLLANKYDDGDDVHVVLMSFAVNHPQQSINLAIDRDWSHLRKKTNTVVTHKRVYVAPAGNDGKGAKSYPAANGRCLGVTGANYNGQTDSYQNPPGFTAALNPTDPTIKTTRYYDSSVGHPEVTDPTVDRSVYAVSGYWHVSGTTDVTGNYGYKRGGDTSAAAWTSMPPQDKFTDGNTSHGTSNCAAQVAALAALLYQYNDAYNRSTVEKTIKRNVQGQSNSSLPDVTETVIEDGESVTYKVLEFKLSGGVKHRVPGLIDFQATLANRQMTGN